jgi:large subunit ribosomal protein L7/L12
MSKKVDSILKELKDLTLVEASELVKAIEEEFGVSAAAAPVAMMAGGVGASAEPVAEEKSEFTIKVTEVPADKKISVIKAVKNILNIGLAEAKTMVESAPFVVKENAPKEEAETLKTELSGAGATVSME